MTLRNETGTVAGPRRHQGRTASAGFAAGPILRLEHRKPGTQARSNGHASPENEQERLARALEAARAALADLVARKEGDASDILAFQLALAEDEELSSPAFASIAAGETAEAAWQAAIGRLIADYEGSAEEYFRARASDLRDLEARVLDGLAGVETAIVLPERAIVVTDDLTPSLFLSLSWEGRGIALQAGSPTSHVAMLARSRAVPMLVGLGRLDVRSGEPALLDAAGGSLVVAPDALSERRFSDRRADARRVADDEARFLRKPAITADGERVEVHINIAGPADLDGLDPTIADGIGLVRTELLFHDRASLPGEDEQAEAYARILTWAEGRPVTIRTLDAGGDKPIPGLTLEDEQNPFLGLRGVRLSLARPEVFATQLRALLRAAPSGNLRIMVPMVSIPAEMESVRRLLAEARGFLEKARVPHGAAKLGMMVEVPAAALTLDLFTTDFVSIGSNDLVQYTLAAGRDSDAVAQLADAASPAVLRLIERIVSTARERQLPVSLCGDAGGDPRVLPLLLAAGLRSVSVSPSMVGATKSVISAFRAKGAREQRPRLADRLGRALGLSGGRRG